MVVGFHEDFTPAWSPDGSWIAYHSHRSVDAAVSYAAEGSTDDIYLRRPGAPSAEEIRLTDFGFEVGMADWSPNGNKLVFDSWEQDEPGWSKPWIATIDTASGRLLDVVRLPLPEGVRGTLFAVWNPVDESRIAFIEHGSGSQQALWVTNPEGSFAEKLLEFEGSTYGGLDWTPDGNTIVYSALVDGRMQLFSVRSAGGEPTVLTHDSASLLHPQVSPDGSWIAATRVVRVNELRRMTLEDE
jgi:Tol biopolymer transport system component